VTSFDFTDLSEAQAVTFADIIKEQANAEAHELYRVLDKDDEAFHAGWRDSAIDNRDELLKKSGRKVKAAYKQYMQIRLTEHQQMRAELEGIKKCLLEIIRLQGERAAERHKNWRSFRSGYAHATDAKWLQERCILEAKQAYLESQIVNNPILEKPVRRKPAKATTIA